MQDGDAPEILKKILFCFRVMSRSFSEPTKAEESFQVLDQLKDANIWKILTNLLDPKTSFSQACSGRVSEMILKMWNKFTICFFFFSRRTVSTIFFS